MGRGGQGRRDHLPLGPGPCHRGVGWAGGQRHGLAAARPVCRVLVLCVGGLLLLGALEPPALWACPTRSVSPVLGTKLLQALGCLPLFGALPRCWGYIPVPDEVIIGPVPRRGVTGAARDGLLRTGPHGVAKSASCQLQRPVRPASGAPRPVRPRGPRVPAACGRGPGPSE